VIDALIVHDDVSKRLDEMADLCAHWKRWREGREYTPRWWEFWK